MVFLKPREPMWIRFCRLCHALVVVVNEFKRNRPSLKSSKRFLKNTLGCLARKIISERIITTENIMLRKFTKFTKTIVLYLNLDGLEWYTTWLSPIALQKKYDEIIRKIHTQYCLLMEKSAKLTTLHDCLLPNAYERTGNRKRLSC